MVDKYYLDRPDRQTNRKILYIQYDYKRTLVQRQFFESFVGQTFKEMKTHKAGKYKSK